jgi:hypothetical protein
MIEKGKMQGEHGGVQVGVCEQREHAFLFQVLLKLTLTQGEGRPRRFPPNNEGVGRGLGGSQPGAGVLDHPQATYGSPKLFLLLDCLILFGWQAIQDGGRGVCRWGPVGEEYFVSAKLQ